jgi:hypothetical protein
MATTAKTAIGAVLNRWNTVGTSGAWQEILEVTALSWDGVQRNIIEVFHLNNSDRYVNKLQGILNSGTITATILYKRDQYITLKEDLETLGNRDYQIVLPDGEALEFSGFISELPLDLGSDDVMQGDVVFAIDGPVDFVSSATP